MTRGVQWPPIRGRGFAVRELVAVGQGNIPPESPPRPPPRPLSAACPEPVEGGAGGRRPGTACCWSIGEATRTLATSVSSPIWLCHQPLHAIAPSQKFVYVEL